MLPEESEVPGLTVIDLRDELYNRKIEIIEITKDFIKFFAFSNISKKILIK